MIRRLEIRQYREPNLPDGRLITWEIDDAGLSVTRFHASHATPAFVRVLNEHTRHMTRNAIMVEASQENKRETIPISYEFHDFHGAQLVVPVMRPDHYVWLIDPHAITRPLLREVNEVLVDVAEALTRWDMVSDDTGASVQEIRQRLVAEAWHCR